MSSCMHLVAEDDRDCLDKTKVREQKIQEYRSLFENPYCAAERGYVDDVIMPSETRKQICAVLDLLPIRKWSGSGVKSRTSTFKQPVHCICPTARQIFTGARGQSHIITTAHGKLNEY